MPLSLLNQKQNKTKQNQLHKKPFRLNNVTLYLKCSALMLIGSGFFSFGLKNICVLVSHLAADSF